MTFPPPDKNNIINLLPQNLSAANKKNIKQFRFFSLLYDPAMKYFIRRRIHKSNPLMHQVIWKKLIGSVSQARILDLACGTGGLISSINKDNHYTGLDLSYEMLKKAESRSRKKGFKRCRLICASAETQIFPRESFDLVITDTALHMIPDWQKTIMEASLSLASSGVLIGAVPVMGIDEEFDKSWEKYSSTPQFHALTKEDLKKNCHENNMDFTTVASNGGMLYFRACKQKQTTPVPV